jgi:hypothetical protein
MTLYQTYVKRGQLITKDATHDLIQIIPIIINK